MFELTHITNGYQFFFKNLIFYFLYSRNCFIGDRFFLVSGSEKLSGKVNRSPFFLNIYKNKVVKQMHLLPFFFLNLEARNSSVPADGLCFYLSMRFLVFYRAFNFFLVFFFTFFFFFNSLFYFVVFLRFFFFCRVVRSLPVDLMQKKKRFFRIKRKKTRALFRLFRARRKLKRRFNFIRRCLFIR